MPVKKLFAAALIAFAAWSMPAHAEEFPSRLITMIVPLTPGTTIDILARLYADKLSQILGQRMVVVNKAGAGTLIGAEAVETANPDGYTLLFTNSAHAILGYVNKNLPFDPIRDFSGVSMIGLAPAVAVVPSKLGVTSLKEFVDLAKAKPGQLNYGSAGVGSSTHLAGAYFAAQAKINIVHVPYTVSANIISDMLSGAIQASFDPLAFILSFVQNGSLRALAIGADKPVTEPVAIPTAESQGVDYRYASWYGILAPANTPKPALKILADAVAKASQDPDLIQKIKVQGIDSRITPLGGFDAYIKDDITRLAPLIKDALAEKQ